MMSVATSCACTAIVVISLCGMPIAANQNYTTVREDFSLSTIQPDLNNNSTTLTGGADCTTPTIAHGTVRDDSDVSVVRQNYTAGDRLEVVCDAGYRVPHIKSTVVHIVCQLGGKWTDALGAAEAPSCQRIGGCALPLIVHGYVTEKENGYMPGDALTVNCNTGYILSPLTANPLMICNHDGSWTPYEGSAIACRAATLSGCMSPSDIRNGGYRMVPSDGFDMLHGTWQSGVRAVYYCDDGYRMSSDDSPVITCTDGSWLGSTGLPSCRERSIMDRCNAAPEVLHARQFILANVVDEPDQTEMQRRKTEETFGHGTKVIYVCDAGFRQSGSATIICNKGEWSGRGPVCHQHDFCQTKPQNVSHADFSIYPNQDSDGPSNFFSDGTRAYYFCHSGYRLAQSNTSTLTCSNGQWTGQLPTCVKRTNCDAPMDIEHGTWIIESMYADYRIGVYVRYECEDGFKRVGADRIHCMSSGYWSDYPPKCLVKDEYCAEPAAIENGFFVCKPSQCNSFRVSTELHYFCNSHFDAKPSDQLVTTCLPGGIWSEDTTITCVEAVTEESSFYTVYLGQNSMRIVISTTCTILGVLLVILFAVALQHRMRVQRARMYEATLPDIPPPLPPRPDIADPMYSAHPSNGDREHDRLALIAFADDPWGASQAVLPTYEESIRGMGCHLGGHASLGLGRSSRCHDYRAAAAVAGVRDMPPTDQRRNSIVTNASNNLSAGAGFGSLDTVNNASDTNSTSVTVDTYDSMASNPSLTASQRAARGSLESSSTHGSLASEAAPLLDHRTSAASGVWEHRDMCMTDTLRSQTSRSLHSSDASSRIVELPEDGKDD